MRMMTQATLRLDTAATIGGRRMSGKLLSRFLSGHGSSLKQQTTSTCFMDDDPPASLIDVGPLAERMRAEVRLYTQQAQPPVRLAGILAHDRGPYRADAEIYAERIGKTLAEDGIEYELRRCSAQTPMDVEKVIREMNAKTSVHGVLVFYPIFKELGDMASESLASDITKTHKRGPYLNRSTGVYYKTFDDYLRDVVSPPKDVEGLCRDYNARRMFRARGKQYTNNEAFVPCTALAVMKILEEYHDNTAASPGKARWDGCTVTVVNRSEILGRPLAALLALEGAIVYSIDENSVLKFKPGGRLRTCPDQSLHDCLQRSSIVVSGVPSPDFVLPSSSIAPDTTVVNVSEFCNVCEDSLLQIPGVRLIPHVGRVTVAALEQNLVRLHRSRYVEKSGR